MFYPLRVSPENADGSASLVGDPKGVHGEFIQRDFIRFFGKPACGGHGEDGFRIGPVGDGKLYGTLSDLRVCELSQAAEADSAFYIRVLFNPFRLMLRQAGI